jgi:proline iminopeptidase
MDMNAWRMGEMITRTTTRTEDSVREGRIAIDDAGHEIWYRLDGDAPETLVGLHGGPGATHDYLLRLTELAGDRLQVLLYDQLGSGKSDRPDDDSLWNVPRFVEELEQVRTQLGLGKVHLLGQSWGGFLALQYVLDHPEGVQSLVLSNTAASVPHAFAEMTRLRSELPADAFMALLRCEAAGDFESAEYKAAVNQLTIRHGRRSTPWDEQRSLEELQETVVPILSDVGPAYRVMWGPHEFMCTGSLLDWDVSDRLGEIAVPTLILTGLYDELTIACHRLMADRIPDNEFVIFGNSSHIVILEKEADAYLGVIGNFLTRVQARA